MSTKSTAEAMTLVRLAQELVALLQSQGLPPVDLYWFLALEIHNLTRGMMHSAISPGDKSFDEVAAENVKRITDRIRLLRDDPSGTLRERESLDATLADVPERMRRRP